MRGHEEAALRALFSGFSAPTPVPFDAGTLVETGKIRRVSTVRELSPDAVARLARGLDPHGVSVGAAVDALWAVVLSRASGATEVLFGVVGAAESAPVPVLVPCAASVDPSSRLVDLARTLSLRFEALRARAPERERLRALVDIPAGQPLFGSAIIAQPAGKPASGLVGEVPLSIEAWLGDRIELRISADAERWDGASLERLVDQLILGLLEIARAPELSVKDICLLSAADRDVVVNGWNARADEPAPEHSVADLFEEQVRKAPSAVAVVFGDTQLTYAELDARANAVARYLKGKGVAADDRVALCVERTPELIVALVGILKAGGAYLPLEPTYPKNRMAFMIEDAEPKVILTQSSLRVLLPEVRIPVTCLDAEPALAASVAASPGPSAATPSSLAYVLYTSGSTGTPKGVEVPHRAIERLVRGSDFARFGPDVTILQAAPVAFDASTFEIWGALLNGGKLVLFPDPVPTAAGLARVITGHGVTTMWLTAALFNTVVDDDPKALSGLSQLLIGGEALSVPHVRRALESLPGTEIINGYGPTETTTFATCFSIPRPFDTRLRSIPIGSAIRQTRLYVLDPERRPVPVGAVGELYIGGKGVARGYLKRPELTGERFLPDPFRAGERVYRTGDLVRFRQDGVVEYIGRADQQVKIRGFRIELGEIESALSRLSGVKNVVVVARPDASGEKRLVSYGVLGEGASPKTNTEIRRELAERLPEYMIPSAFVWLPALPVTLNGKVDHRALPDPNNERPDLAVEYLEPGTPVEQKLTHVLSEMLGLEKVGVRDNFFDLGASSLLVVRFVARLEREGIHLPVVKVFELPTVAGLAAHLAGKSKGQGLAERVRHQASSRRHAALEGIAIVGMAGRFPGAATVDELWKNLCGGVESISFFADAELDPFLAREVVSDPAYVKARGVIEGVELFDAGFFGITPKEAKLMDPQARILLEVAWETLENAGYCPEGYAGTIGVFAGKYNNTYYAENVVGHPDLIAELGAFQTMVANEKDYIATRIAHRINLRGPALSIHTACSTSLVAVVQAVQNLMLGQCDMALAGGVSLTVPVKSGYVYQEGAMLSVDGHTRTFDAKAQGTVFSDGAAMVLLKRVSDAIRDGDTIYGVIRGAATNNDGGDKASFTAPSVEGQAAVIAAAQAQAGVSARDVTYVEAHGTATPLGDPIEVEALTQAFRLSTTDIGFCALGSIKSNLGHMVIAAGAAGLIKTALCLSNKTLVPSLLFDTPNPKLNLRESPFAVNTELRPWTTGTSPRLAGVSSFGVGGTNAHVVVEEPPPQVSEPSGPSELPERSTQLLVLSARSEEALAQAGVRLANHLDAHPGADLADVAFTLHAGRRAFPFRRAVTAATPEEAARVLRGGEPRRSFAKKARGRAPGVAFLFPGQGAQYPGMGATLYREHPVFRAHVDLAAEVLRPLLGSDIREMLFPKAGGEAAAAEALRQTSFTQPALFVVEYSLSRLWESFGVVPETMIGHSVGEFVCAALSSVFEFEDAVRLVAARGLMMQGMPPGGMLSVRLPAAEVERDLPSSVSIASDNGPSLCVVAGPTEDVELLRQLLEGRGTVVRLLQTSHAFHSSMMDPVVEPFRKLVEKVTLRDPKIPFVSTATGDFITGEQAKDPAYWARHLRLPVQFKKGVRKLWDDGDLVLLEVGPRGTLSTLARQQITDRTRQVCFTSMGDDDAGAWNPLLGAAGQLWAEGALFDATALHGPSRRRRVPLPTYPFARQRFWVDPARTTSSALPSVSAAAPASQGPAVTLAVTVAAETPQASPSDSSNSSEVPMSSARRDDTIATLKDVLEEASGLELTNDDNGTPFVELGLDSLFLTQFALALGRRFKIKITFRELLERYPTLDTLAAEIESKLPAAPPGDSAPASAVAPVVPVAPAAFASAAAALPGSLPIAAAASPAFMAAGSAQAAFTVTSPPGTVQHLIEQQLRLMAQQLAVLGGVPLPAAAPPQAAVAAPAAAPPSPAPASASAPPRSPAASNGEAAPASARSPGGATDDEQASGMMKYDVKKAFGAIARITVAKTEDITPKQKARLEAFTRRYNDKTKGSKQFAQESRAVMADPRAVTGFRPAIKELIYPLAVDRSKGSKLWDVDGNEYVDALNGFGLNLFGWQPEFVTRAIEEQLHRGHEIGPQHPLQAEVARLICEMTGFDRAGFCNTGSEAVMGCMRIARTVTGRSKIAIFTGGYHGIFDEVVVRGTKKLRSIPAAPGIMPSTSENVIVLDYGTDESLEILKSRADELAAIVVEPIQSRRPDFQPREFLHQLRELTSRAGIVYVFDEVVTGFRMGPGGAQEFFGVKADLASYGKIVGGGLPIGVIAGKKEFVDALDGGYWQFGDDSVPPTGVTYFAGTFVRHPLALAAAKAVLGHLKEQGPSLQRTLNDRTTAFAADLNAFMEEVGAPIKIKHFASLWKTFYTADQAFGDVLFYMMRDRGVHIYDGFPCFFTTAHAEADFAHIAKAYKDSVLEMQESGFLPERKVARPASAFDANTPPVPGARLGRDPNGNPAWYTAHPLQPGKYVKVEQN